MLKDKKIINLLLGIFWNTQLKQKIRWKTSHKNLKFRTQNKFMKNIIPGPILFKKLILSCILRSVSKQPLTFDLGGVGSCPIGDRYVHP